MQMSPEFVFALLGKKEAMIAALEIEVLKLQTRVKELTEAAQAQPAEDTPA